MKEIEIYPLLRVRGSDGACDDDERLYRAPAVRPSYLVAPDAGCGARGRGGPDGSPSTMLGQKQLDYFSTGSRTRAH